ncbi:MAG: SAM-dependent chlorinase/fluorinase [Pseudomonadota bacterium]
MSRTNIITLLTDFGLRDTYVAQMKAVVLGVNPLARLIDLTHGIAAGDIREAAHALESACFLFPPGTVHLAVVDPGVGSARAPLALKAAGFLFVGPDNGIFTPALAADPEARAFRLREDVGGRVFSATFHGRDIFAPAAAHLSLGRNIEEIGEFYAGCAVLPLARARHEEAAVVGEIRHVDHFGNLISNITPQDLQGRVPKRIRVGSFCATGILWTYSDVGPGECLALWGGSGRLEVSCRGESAARRLGLGVGDAVVMETS